MVRTGVEISGVQEVLDHAIIITTRRYVSRDIGVKRRAMELLSQSRNTPKRVWREAVCDFYRKKIGFRRKLGKLTFYR